MRTINDEITRTTKVATTCPREISVKPTVSVLVVTYNHEKFIEHCIQSIVGQKTTFAVEIIVCDDCSSDDTPSILEALTNLHSNIRLYHGSRENNIKLIDRPSGRYSAFQAIAMAKGEYIAWMDGDDFWTDEHKLQQQYEAMQKNPDWSMCFTLGHLLYLDGSKRGVWLPDIAEFDALNCYKRLRSQELASSRLFRSKYFKGPVPEWLLTALSDGLMDLWASIHGPIGWIPLQSTCYRLHSTGIYQGANMDFRTQVEFYRAQQLLLFGENETWLSPQLTFQKFKHLIKSYDNPCVLRQFERLKLTNLLKFGAMRRLSLFYKARIMGYWLLKFIQSSVTRVFHTV